jgi:hypothetical protein
MDYKANLETLVQRARKTVADAGGVANMLAQTAVSAGSYGGRAFAVLQRMDPDYGAAMGSLIVMYGLSVLGKDY